MTVYFTSDTHYGHTNVIKHSGRPFASVEEMNEAMITRWNAVVRPGDLVYHLGDLSFLAPADTNAIASRLAGQKYLIRGNHDDRLRGIEAYFHWVKDTATIKVEGQKIFLSHYAHRVWESSHHGAWNLHGHSHGSLPRLPGYKQLDVGVDCWDFAPVSFERLKLFLDPIQFTSVDHHGSAKPAEVPEAEQSPVTSTLPIGEG